MVCLFFIFAIKYGILDVVQSYEKVMNKVNSQLSQMNDQTMDEGLNMVSTIKLFSQEDKLVDEYQEAQNRYMQSINIRVVLRCVREFGYGTLKAVSFSVALFFSIKELKSGTISSGKLTAFFLLFRDVQGLIGGLKWRKEQLWRDFPDIQRFLDLMQVKCNVVSGSLKPKEVIGEISFKDVTFSYPSRPGDDVLKGLTMTLKPNSVTAIVGQSGAGKSTISKLLMRIYDPKAGSISLDGINLKELDLLYFHEQVAIVNQNPVLFNCSLRENIAYGAKRIVTDEEIFSAAKQANCYDFIMKFRGKFDTGAGSKGGRLSGGQKQRIAIARAIVCDPKILILDEATSSLDSESERLVHEALDRLMEGRSTMVIAHRLSTIKNAHTIIFMSDGKVLEQGTHDQLTQKEGHYYNLILNQLL
jgi:ABC-type multidrug transport system fused ATPase/permease subunit